jgi:predicted nucleotidyltransferase
MNSLVSDCKGLFGDKLTDVRLYGSYARGDHSEHSDIDVMILLDMDGIEARKHLGQVCEIASEIDLEHGVVLSPVVRSKYDYDRLKELPGFYNNVLREGVSIVAG